MIVQKQITCWWILICNLAAVTLCICIYVCFVSVLAFVFVFNLYNDCAETNHMLVDSDLQFSTAANQARPSVPRQFLVPTLIGNGQAGLVITYNAT